MTDEALLQEAVRLAGEHSADGSFGPFGAVVARDGHIVGIGWNRVVATPDPTAHAEVEAIRDACRKLGTHVLGGCTIYCSCEPCPLCLSAIYWARIPRVVYASTKVDARNAGFDDADIYAEVARAWPDRSLESVHLPLPDADRVLQRWDAQPQRARY